MATSTRSRISPMQTAGTRHLIERTYRESGTFQWVRESYKNSIEAGANRVEYGIEWMAVENLGVYRRLIADNGGGMDSTRLPAFMNTFGGGGKPIGGVHENFGVGAKTSLLPWNKYGVVVISWVPGDPAGAMIWLLFDEVGGEYGLKNFLAINSTTGAEEWTSVVEPFDDVEHGVDWSQVKPDFIKDHGTVVVLLGNNPTEDTVLGDPNRNEADIKGISSYLNRRVWDIPNGLSVMVDELRTQERGSWPTSEQMAHKAASGGPGRRTNRRVIEGAHHFVEYPGFKSGKIAADGTQALTDGTQLDWFLWDGDRPSVHTYASEWGYIAALYQNELYDVTSHAATYRSFGVSEGAVRQRVWLILRPQEYSGDRTGIYPRTDRNSLLLRGGPNAGGALPINDWGHEFAENMPEPIRRALRAQRAGVEGSIQDEDWRQRLMERFGKRWRSLRLRMMPGGPQLVVPVQPGTAPRKPIAKHPVMVVAKPPRPTSNSGTGQQGAKTVGRTGAGQPAQSISAGQDLPKFITVHKDDLEDPGLLAAWQPPSEDYPSGVVLLNIDHELMEQEIEYWQAQFSDVYAEKVRADVIHAYGEIAVSKIAHSEAMKAVLSADFVEKELRSPAALTMALLGLVAEEAVLAPRLGGRYGRRHTVVSAEVSH